MSLKCATLGHEPIPRSTRGSQSARDRCGLGRLQAGQPVAEEGSTPQSASSAARMDALTSDACQRAPPVVLRALKRRGSLVG